MYTAHIQCYYHSEIWNTGGCGVRLMTCPFSKDQEEFPFSPLSWKLLTFTEKGAPKPYKCPLEFSMLSSKNICKKILCISYTKELCVNNASVCDHDQYKIDSMNIFVVFLRLDFIKVFASIIKSMDELIALQYLLYFEECHSG